MKPITTGALLIAAIVCGCVPSKPTAPGNDVAVTRHDVSAAAPLRVTVTVGMVADLVRNVGGDRVVVQQICGSGVDPHLYKVTRDDVQALRQAELVFYCGLMLEGKMSATLGGEARRRPVIAIAESIASKKTIAPEGASGHPDPHVWMDVEIWAEGVDVVAETLTKYDPAGAASYHENAQRYREKLSELHAYGKRSIATIPASARLLVTSHDAFNYFGRAYGIEVVGVQGISTESEAGLQRINELVAMLVERKVQSVFVESSVASDQVEALLEGARARGHTIRLAQPALFSDAMGTVGTYEGTYIGMLDHNITVVTRGLGGDAPQRGLLGKLNL